MPIVGSDDGKDFAPTPANWAALTPLTFLDRAAQVYPERTAVIHGALRYSWREVDERCRRLASALAKLGIGRGDTVAVMLPNIPGLIEAHFGVPSNNFGAQEPGSSAEIQSFCATNYRVDFPLTEKVDVVGPQAHPFYRWAAGELGAASAPKWNFHKYLVGPDGRLAGFFASEVAPEAPEITRAVEALLPS